MIRISLEEFSKNCILAYLLLGLLDINRFYDNSQ